MPEAMFDQEKNLRIRERAYQLFLARDTGGDALSDWLEAERQIDAQESESRYRGPARVRTAHLHGTVTDHSGCDIENPA
jgi:hypothetical protein